MRKKLQPGLRQGRLELLKVVGRSKGRALWLCKCDCGTEKVCNAQNFSHGSANSCGCLQREWSHRLGKSRIGKFGNSARNAAINVYKRLNRYYTKREWQITDEYAELLLTQPCLYCGSSPSMKKETQSGIFIHGGIDRIDSSKGYIMGNVVPCCYMCNLMKNKFSQDFFLSHVENIVAHQNIKKLIRIEVN